METCSANARGWELGQRRLVETNHIGLDVSLPSLDRDMSLIYCVGFVVRPLCFESSFVKLCNKVVFGLAHHIRPFPAALIVAVKRIHHHSGTKGVNL